MTTTNAALVTSFDEPPHFQSADLPEPAPDGVAANVLAVGLHPRVRSGAAGAHYTSSGELPLVPGVDGVAQCEDGRVFYFVGDSERFGTMVERTHLNPRRAVELAEGSDPVTVAAAMNPAMSSWVAMACRTEVSGVSVVVFGATGSAGGMAIQLAKIRGASRVIAVGRDTNRLAQLGPDGDLGELAADATVALASDPEETRQALRESGAADAGVVLDYLWGDPTRLALETIARGRSKKTAPLDWVQIGSMAGSDLALPSAALRAINLRMLGSGQGSIGLHEYARQLPDLLGIINSGTLKIATRTVPLAEVERAWLEPEPPGVRTVLVP